ncbi:MAG TPA: ABC transporter permease, partial [Blastocatellia bacterium]|nr:ABC transporter permease [Blastocatellia bacterium]
REWDAELEYREELVARWDRLDWRGKLKLLWRSLGAFWDALWLQQLRWEDEMIQDLRYGVRMMLKHKGFTMVAALTLALGIGANTAIFTVMNALLLRPLPVKDPGELVLLASANRNGAPVETSPTAKIESLSHTIHIFSHVLYEQLRDGAHSLSGLFGVTDVSKQRMQADGLETEFIRAQGATGAFFATLGAPAALGRTFTTEDDQAGAQQRVAVISHSFWQRRFGADPAVVGKTITFEDAPLTIVGVTPPGFFGIEPGEHPDLWAPAQQILSERALKDDSIWPLRLMGRLTAGRDRAQAQAELDLIYQRHLAGQFTRAATWSEMERRLIFDRKLEAQPGAAGDTELRRQFRRPLLLLMAAVGLVLLIACANVASLLLARAAARGHEFTMRSALGAGRLRLVRQLLTESLLLAALGGGFGLLFSQWGTQALMIFMRLHADPISFNVAPDTRALLFTLAATLLTGLLFGLAPALRAGRLDLASALKRAGGNVAGDASRQKLNQTLVVAQVALSLVLLISAGLFIRTLGKLKTTENAGFNRENVVVFNIDFTRSFDDKHRTTLYRGLLARLETLPGVSVAGMSADFLLRPLFSRDGIIAEGYTARPGEDLGCHVHRVSQRYFETMGFSLVSGRGFGPQDERPAGPANPSALQPAVINQAMARRYFGDANPIGRRFGYLAQPGKFGYEIVGVVRDGRYVSLRMPPPPAYYKLAFHAPDGWGMTFAMRTTSDASALASSLRRVARDVEPAIQVRDVRSLDDVVNAALHQERVLTQLGVALSLFALALACLGLYSVLSFAVVQRTREIGVRIALGAQRKDVLSLVVGRGVKLAALGLAIGLPAALVVTRFVATLLYGVTATDPVVFIGVSLLLLLVAMLASWLPARRATEIDPITVLRHE